MAGLSPDTPLPTAITLHQRARELEIAFEDGLAARLSFEFLRVHSPSAEVRGHGQGQEVLQFGKRDVEVRDILPVGQYAVRLLFSDGHDSGIYSWDYLHLLTREHENLWQQYLGQLEAAGASRDPAAPVPEHLRPRPAKACGKH
ncbi:MAG: 1-(5-phosphoribosyl)-5-((5-phosphoribosylamino)methylideneamino)imidazole-4-carboxamide isomerase [Candidatus Dactylopiibacterium carminicum]|uniref:1-(5-phosphoribosyl)-5-((5-phosphoribosylamino)methylideneamino)imidazole-4-carboxamide isomerase n=1 Tax=Candidatus Dactylopiibacterium carminicum TaxID=857335 RepID=A0A272EW14_9RHOO|nr:DUF971 domain-containing protein [Candidatus Dactylopiibacterium carminicum]KAF7599502.1 DUF971 domain-containing protein [Candidatus Dactylopiibacterium carminicum]PAS94304.1 MAG: 1-(5-phosphoribosyl)-5-((5-phosphoribosylamino)methylideneamino)imidazole-4-carboxamide isomerase [Candidatus Dactylopiibacterium carminicum]PAS98498.1 MAG: 1-(5-phosphoribosyl)-5-((5-phosphoribosylamino)methylideneamino)imidazole-4-carboxamide isomerase [Candidatus Dactylopiibacterium carminicum]PAS99510.1 MAG: 1